MGLADTIIITCEHGGKSVPREHARLMKPVRSMLATHRGFDPGALELAQDMAAAFRAPLHFSTTTRLLVDLNRSPDASDVFGPSVKAAPPDSQRAILERFYLPYRRAVEADVRSMVRRRNAGAHAKCTHISVHSFTPVLRGKRRAVDIGLLFDPNRSRERALVDAWIAAMDLMDLGLRIRRNEPYKGTADGFTTHLRTLHPDQSYAGIEIEVNQRLVRSGGTRWLRVRGALIAGLAIALETTRCG